MALRTLQTSTPGRALIIPGSKNWAQYERYEALISIRYEEVNGKRSGIRYGQDVRVRMAGDHEA